MQCIQIGDQVHKFSNIVPEAQSSPFEVYRHKHSSSSPKIDLLGRVTHKIQVRRGLDSSSMERIKNRTEEAERERNSRKYSTPFIYTKYLLSFFFRAVFLEKPPPAKRTAPVHARHNSSNSRAYLSVYENKSGSKGSGVRSLPSSPLLRPTAGSSTPKYLPIGGSPRIAPISSPRLRPSSPKPATTPLRVRLIHILALGPATEHILQEKTRALRTELSTCLQDVARKIAPGSASWELKDESYRDLKPKEWKNYTSKEREMVEKKQAEIVAKLPPPPVESEIPKKRTESDVSETARPLAMTPKPVDSPARERHTTPVVPAKRPAEEEAANPVRKVGGGIISTKKKSTKVTPKDPATAKTAAKETVVSTATKAAPTKKSKDNPKVKSAEKIIDSDSDSDVPLEKQIKHVVAKPASKPSSSDTKTTGLKGLGISTIEPETKRQIQTVSPPISNTYRSRTSSSSSANSYSPPKKRSPLATNEPVTAHRKNSPVPPSPPPVPKNDPEKMTSPNPPRNGPNSPRRTLPAK